MQHLARLLARLPDGVRRRAVVLKGRHGLAIDRTFLRWTGYSLITLQYAVARGGDYCPTLLLTTVGRRTGEQRTVALPWVSDGDDVLVVGSAAGGPKDPAWVENLRADPRCLIRRGRRTEQALARIATGAERERVYDRLVEVRPVVADYEVGVSAQGRALPLVVLSPQDGATAADLPARRPKNVASPTEVPLM